MANYIAWYGKKRKHLIEREREFIALLQAGADGRRIAEAAEAVRAAKVRALKSKRAEFPPSEKSEVMVQNLELQIEFWLALPVEKIVEGYRGREQKDRRGS